MFDFMFVEFSIDKILCLYVAQSSGGDILIYGDTEEEAAEKAKQYAKDNGLACSIKRAG